MEFRLLPHNRILVVSLREERQCEGCGKNRVIDEETGLWIIKAVGKTPDMTLPVLYRIGPIYSGL